MESTTKQGYVAGLLCLLAAIIFGVSLFNTGLESSGGKLLVAFTLIFGGLSVLSLIKPDSIGVVAWEFLQHVGSQDESTQTNQEINVYGDNFGNVGNSANESNNEQSTDFVEDDSSK